MKLVVVEDSQLVLAQLLRMVEVQPMISVVGTAADEDSAVRLIGQTQPDVILLDLALSQGTGIQVLSRIRQAGSSARVLVLTNNASEPFRRACEPLGISGFYDKSREFARCMERLFSLTPAT